MNYTIKDADASFALLCKALGKELAVWDKETRSFNPGSWELDYPTYGGCVIHEHTDNGASNSGVSTPFGDTRRTPREFCSAVSFALDALRIREVRLAHEASQTRTASSTVNVR
jgi:hypothetical protein